MESTLTLKIHKPTTHKMIHDFFFVWNHTILLFNLFPEHVVYLTVCLNKKKLENTEANTIGLQLIVVFPKQ